MFKNMIVVSFCALLLLTSSNAFSATVTWTGGTSTDWGTATNWNTGAVPTESDAVIIADVTNDPILDLPRTINTLTINTGGLLTLNGKNLTVSGNLTVKGTLYASIGTPTITVGGNWDSSTGIFFHKQSGIDLGSTVVMTGIGKTIKTPSDSSTFGGTRFYNLEINGDVASRERFSVYKKLSIVKKTGYATTPKLTVDSYYRVAVIWGGDLVIDGGILAGQSVFYMLVNDESRDHVTIINGGRINIDFIYQLSSTGIGRITPAHYEKSLNIWCECSDGKGELGYGYKSNPPDPSEIPILEVDGSMYISGAFYGGEKATLDNTYQNINMNITNALVIGNDTNKRGVFKAGSATINVDGVLIRDVTAGDENRLEAGGSIWNISGAYWKNYGEFDAGTSTINLTGGDQLIVGSTTFHNLSKTVPGAASYTLTFDHTATQTVTNSLTLQGSSNYYLKLRSDLPGTQYNLKFLNTAPLAQDLDYLDVNDNNASGGARLDCPNCNDNDCAIDNNINWRFNNTIECSEISNGEWTGASSENNYASNFANWSNNTLPHNGDDIVFKGNAPGCTWNLQNITPASFIMEAGYAGDVILNEDLTVVDSVTISGGSLSLGNGSLTTNTLTIDTGKSLVLNGKNLTVSGNITVNGTLNASVGTPTITVGGNWDSSTGTFTYGNSTVIFTGSGKTITLPVSSNNFGPTRFYNLEIRGTVSTVLGKGKFRTDKDLVISGKLTLNDTASVDYDGNLFISSTGELAGSYGYFYRFTNDSTNNIDYPGYDNNGHIIIESVGNNKGIISRDIFAYLVGTGSTNAPITATSYKTLQIYAENQETPLVSTGVLGPAGSTLTLTGNMYIAGYRNYTDDFVTLDNSVNNIPIIAANGNLTLGSSKATGTLIAGSASYDFVNININNYTGAVNGRSDKIEANNSTWNVSGNWAVNGNAVFDGGTSTVIFDGINKAITSGGYAFNNLVFNSTSSTWTLQDSLIVNNDLTLTSGTLNTGANKAITVEGNVDIDGTLTANNSLITVGGSWDTSGGTFTAGTSTVDLTGSGALTIPAQWWLAGNAFYNIKVSAAGKTTDLMATIKVLNELTIGGGKLTGPLYTVWLEKTGSGTVLNLDPAAEIMLDTFFIFTSAGGTMTIPAGNYGTLTNGLILNGRWTNSNTFNFAGNMTVDGNLILRGLSTYNFDPIGAGNVLTVKGIVAGGTNYDNSSITANFGSSIVHIGTNGLDTGTDALVAGPHTLNLDSATVNNAGKWDLISNADRYTIVNPGTSTVNLTGANQVITGSTTFYNLSKTVTTADTLRFDHTATQTVMNDLKLQGSSGGLLSLRSDLDGSQYGLRLQLDGSQDITYLDVKDSNASGGEKLKAGLGSNDSNNNTNWIFNICIDNDVDGDGYGSGSACYQDNCPMVSNPNQRDADNDGIGDVCDSCQNNPDPACSATLTWDGSESSNWNDPNNWDLGIVPNPGDSLIIPDVVNDPVLDLSRTIKTLTIDSAGLLNLNGNNLTVDGNLTVNGTLDASTGTPTITVGGSWDTSGGTFTAGTSTVDLTGSGTLAIPTQWYSSGNAFYNLRVAAAGKTTDLMATIKVLNELTIGGGKLTGPLYTVWLEKTGSGTVLNLDPAAEIMLDTFFVFTPAGGTMTIPAGNYGTLTNGLKLIGSEVNNSTFDFAGNVTVGGNLILRGLSTYNFDPVGAGNVLTVKGIVAGGTNYDYSTITANFGSSIVHIGTNGLDTGTDALVAGPHTLNLDSATVNNAGKWDLTYDAGRYTVINAGTSTVTFNGTTVQMITDDLTFNNFSIAMGSNVNLTGHDFTANGDLAINGTLDASTGSPIITVGGNWDSATGIFNAGASTINLTGVNQVITGSTTFYNLSKTITSSDTLTFDHTATQTITNNLKLQGVSGGILSLRSDLDGSQHRLILQAGASQNLQYLDVKDSDASGGEELNAGVESNDSSNNNNWIFGGVFTWTGTVSSSWGDALNWKNSLVPEFKGNVIIPQVSAGAYNPVIDAPGVYLKSLTIQAGGHLGLSYPALNVFGDIVNYGTINAATGGQSHINVSGSWKNMGMGTFLCGQSSVNFNSTSNGVIASNGSPFWEVYINQGIWTLQDNMEASSLFVSNYATLDTSGSNFSLTTDHLVNSGVINANSSIVHIKNDNDLDLSGGTFNGGASTVILYNLASNEIRVIAGTNPLCNIEFRSGTWRIENDLAINGSLTISSGKVNVSPNVNVTIPGDLVVNGQLDAESNSVFIVGGDVTLTNIFDIGTGSYISVGGSWDNQNGSSITVPGIIFTGGSSHTIHTGGVSFQDVVFNNPAGSWLLQDAITMKNMTITAGTLDTSTSNYDLTVSENLNIATGGALNANGSRVLFIGASNGTVTMASSPLYNVEIDKSSGILTLGSDLTVLNNLIIISGTLNTGLNRTLDVGGNLGINGTLIANSSLIYVAGDWINSGNFTCGLSTVTLDGTNQTIWGNNTFYNLIKMTSVADTLRFESGKTQTVRNNLTLQGTEGNRLSLVSTDPGTPWYINPVKQPNLAFVDIVDAHNMSTAILFLDRTNSIGNNVDNIVLISDECAWLYYRFEPDNVSVSFAGGAHV